MKPWVSVKENKKKQTANLCVSLETNKKKVIPAQLISVQKQSF